LIELKAEWRQGNRHRLLPRLEDLELDGLTVPRERIASLFEVKLPEWKGEVPKSAAF
jgi:GTP-dependent phosphoenolpyruvate carboxykinase